MERAYRFYFLAWMLSLSVITASNWHPPMITKFLQKDLVNPNDVNFAFKLPCEASGTNLTWKWKHNDTDITTLSNRHYSLSEDGTLSGRYLAAKHGGSYQCFVKDEKIGIEVFSRKLKLAVTVLGEFIDRKDVVKKVDLGQSFYFQCPEHTASFGAVFNWVKELSSIHLSRNERRGISLNGTLFVAHITEEDIEDINRIKCRMSAGNSYVDSKSLKLEKNNPQQTDPHTFLSPSWADVPAAEEFAIEGKSKTLYCFANGRPTPTITWKKNGQKIINGQNSFEILSHYYGRRLTIATVNKTRHQDVYTCEANNGQPLIHTINLMVKVAPRWTKDAPPRKNISIVIERNKTLECNVIADPEASITWYKNGILLQSSAHLKVEGNKLYLKDVNLTDDGVYQCAAENKYGMIVSATWVQVMAWKPSFADGQLGPFSLLHGSEGRLQCKPSAEPRPTFQWFRNGVLISYGINSRYILQPDGTLLIKDVDKDKDAVNYTCKAENMMGQDSATIVPVVYVRPSFITKPRNQTVLEKETVTFHCDASGNPTPSTTWLKDGKTVGSGNTLRFETTWRYQSGRYWCWAENGLNVTVKASADLNVQFLPIFTSPPTDQTVKEGDEATFYCTATGNPTPRITWLKDGKTVATGDTLSFVAFDNNSGNYWCSADNGLGLAITTSAHLNVQFPPHLLTKPRNQTVAENETVKFQCTATGNPTPKITWSKDGKTVGTGSELAFVALRSHTGSYWCSADNGLSAGVKENAYLRVLYVPSPPSNVTITKCDDWTAKLSWIPGRSNDAPITHYLIEQQSNANSVVFRLLYNVTNPSATSVSLKLRRGSVLRFRMRAVDNVGTSRPSSTVETTCKSIETNKGALQVKETPIFHKAWFLTLLVLVAYVLLCALLAVLYRSYNKRKGVKYDVAKREKKRGCKDEGTQAEQNIGEEDTNSLVMDARNKPTEKDQHRNSRPLSNYSLFEIQFCEDGSFTEEYGEQDEMIQGTAV